MTTMERTLVEEVKGVFLRCLADGLRLPVAELRAEVPAELAQRCCEQTSPIVLADLPDPLDFGRSRLTDDALRSLAAEGRCEVEGPRGKEEVRLTAAALAALVPANDAVALPEGRAQDQSGQPAGGAEAVAGVDSRAESSESTVGTEDVILDDEFASLLPPHTPEELAQLEQNLLAEKGPRDALVVWKGRNILVDGYGRRALCQKHGLACRTVERDFPDRAAVRQWILDNQRGRRNLTPERAAYLRGEIYQAEKQSHGGTGANQHVRGPQDPAEQGGNSCHSARTEKRLADEFKVSPRTIRNDAAFAGAVDAIAANCGPEARTQILDRKTPLSRKEVVELAGQKPEEQRRVLQEVTGAGRTAKGRRGRAKEAPKEAKAEEATVTVPKEPQALAEELLRQLGREAAAEVHQALGRLLGPLMSDPPKGPRRRSAGAS